MKADAGQALVELALALPVALSMMLGVVLVTEVGVARLALEHGAAEGARAGALTNDDEAVRGSVAAAVTPLDPARVDVAIEPSARMPPRTGDPRGSTLTVRLRYAVSLPLAFIGVPRYVVTSSAARRIEWTRD